MGVSKEALGFVFDVSYYWVDNGDQCGNAGGAACKWNGGMATFYNDYAYSAEGGTSYRDLTRDEVVFSISRSFYRANQCCQQRPLQWGRCFFAARSGALLAAIRFFPSSSSSDTSSASARPRRRIT